MSWRGPRKFGAIRQFLAEVNWGDLDHLVVDCPPGTGDEPLGTAELIGHADGAIIVTTPQEVALLDSRKCVSFARELGVPVAGIVENMSGLVCPHCQGAIDLFGVGGGERMAGEMEARFLGKIPMELELREGGDAGVPAILSDAESTVAKSFLDISDKIMGELQQ